jgi:hypothetical protein
VVDFVVAETEAVAGEVERTTKPAVAVGTKPKGFSTPKRPKCLKNNLFIFFFTKENYKIQI